jgi:amino acid adenylation domain-containing protein
MKLSKGSDYTLHMILAAALTTLLYRYNNNDDITLGMPIYRQKSDREFLNTALVVRNQVNGNMNFKELLLQVRQTIVEANENQNYPLETLLYQLNMPATGNDFPLFDIVVLLENIQDKKYVRHTHPNMIFSFSKKENSLEGLLEYNPSLYQQGMIDQIIEHYTRILETTIFDLDLPLSRIDLLSGNEKEQLLHRFNATRTTYPADKTIDRLFAEQADKEPDRAAVINGEQVITYGLLHDRSQKLAISLQRRGIKNEDSIGVMAEDSLEMIIGILATLKAGGAYLPINPEYPLKRQKFLLREGGAKILLTDREEADDYGIETTALNKPGIYNTPGELQNTHTCRNLAYIIYTSGSTGIPKGVMVEHRSVVRLVKNTNYVEFKKEDRILQTGALDFDASTFEIWGALLNGLQLYLVNKETILTPAKLKKAMVNNRITTIWMTSALFNRMLEEDIEIFRGLQNLLAGGEVLSPQHINRLKNKFPGIKVINGYGPTENTTFSTTHPIERFYKGSIPIGSPIANSTAYIVDRYKHLVPIGVPGELWVGGDGLSRGYMNNPEYTKEKFIINPFVENGRIYRTGDLACWLPDGNIDFLGRIDQQVKIRGYRIEPGEVEIQLEKIDFINNAAVIVMENGAGEKYLCAYAVSDQEIDFVELKRILSKYLPDYMIPASFVQLAEIPLTPNGKVDRRALPEPEIAAGENYAAPRNRTEKRLAGVWSEVLQIDEDLLSIDTDFFDLGGHSLKATIMIAKIHKEFNVKIPLAEIFNSPTIRELAEYIKEISGEDDDKFIVIDTVEEKEYYELASAQKRLYSLQQLEPGITSYNVPQAYLVEGHLDKTRLEEAIHSLIQRHESLRTSFHMIDKQPVQKIHEFNDIEFAVEYREIENTQEEETVTAAFIRPFELARAPLLRVALFKTGRDRHIFMVDMHHVITDGVSISLFIKEFADTYAGKKLSPPKLTYKDFSEWQNNMLKKGEIEKQADFWRNLYKGDIPVLNLPTDFERPEIRDFSGDHLGFFIDEETTAKLKQMTAETGTTLYIALLTVVYILLHKYSRQEDIVVGSPITGRRHADLQDIIGMFVNMLAMRNAPTQNKTILEFLVEVKERSLETMENQDYQFEELALTLGLQGKANRNPLFDVAFAMQNMGHEIDEKDHDLKVSSYRFKYEISKFDMTFFAAEFDNKIKMEMEYSTELFKTSSAQKISEHFVEILKQVVENQKMKLGDIKISHKLLKTKSNLRQEEDGDFAF